VTVTPAISNLTAGQTKQLSATAYDQFGVSMSSQPSFTWAIASGAGSVSLSGLYTSPASGTAASVTATTGGVQGASGVYVVDAPWISADIGSVSATGSAYNSGGVFTINSQTGDIWGSSDTFHYVYRSIAGNGMMIARISAQQNTSAWAKAGIMLRNSTAVGDQYAAIEMTPGNGASLQYRSTSGGNAVEGGRKTGIVVPYWVKLVRSGNTITGYSSANGTGWTQVGSAQITMGSACLIGLESDSNNTSSMNTSTFDSVSMLVAASQSIAVNPGGAGTVNVLANTTGPSGATLTVTGVTQGARGTVVNNGNGTVTYTANANALGRDSFVCTISDGLGDTATMNVTVFVNGIQAYYKFDESTGSTTADATGDGFTGTITGATWTTGVEGTGGLAFNGTNATYVTIPALNLNSDTVTISGWVKRNGTQSGWNGIVFTRDSSSACGLHFGTANELRYTWNDAGSTYNWNSALIPPNGQWTFVALVISATNAKIYMQPLGGSMTSATNNVANAAGAFNGVTIIGGDSNSSSRFINASIDEVRFYNTSLSATQIAALANPAPTVAAAAAATPGSVTGTTTSLSALGASNIYNESSLTYTWTATSVPSGATVPGFSANGTNAAKNTMATFSKAGAYTLRATIADPSSASITSSVNVTVNQTLTSVAVTPASATLGSHSSQQFAAAANDQFGNAMSTQPGFTWSSAGAGSVNTTGLYTASYAAGNANVTASTGSVSGSAGVTVSNAAPTVATSASASPGTVTGTTANFSVLGADGDGGGESNLTYTWAATAVPGGAAAPTYSDNETNAAKNTTASFSKAGAYSLAVTITDAGGGSTISTVNVMVNQTLMSISVSPSTANLSSHGTQQFSATGYDQFGNALSSQPSFAWSKSGSGTVSASGLFIAPYASESENVTASSGGVSKSASVMVANAAPTIATAASASPSAVTGLTTNLSVLGADGDGEGESNLTYHWAATTVPNGVNAPTFTLNDSNTAKAATANFRGSGAYTFTVTTTDLGGASVTSSVNVTVNMKPFSAWEVQKFGANANNPAIAGPMANPAGDGIVNLLKYAFNADPLVPSTAALPIVTVSGGNLVLTYLKNDAATDLTFTLRQSTDLLTWTAANPTLTTLSDTNGTSTIQATVPTNGSFKLMLRLSVTQQ
jgi:hypothetical protein